MGKGNIHKHMTEENGFDRHFACWCNNHNKVWHREKVRQRRRFRRKLKVQLLKERAYNERF
ncbi:hypothetical protein [Ruminococcus albus]|uniref:Uncharacterized protein n=1 Tax=Ruminococcus albus (strain ATCC 27210 / DSM 20455 / JCM 14654 / NCDO 2250 / 7) TaxID=697329 RepID=E6UBL8_RUMA7|nr:hypothetical protein [Ruminococcus albus]ADU22638.1 hypothetical protein Rumal_2150 [Ruminococcus albus 7 = DSM 20455]